MPVGFTPPRRCGCKWFGTRKLKRRCASCQFLLCQPVAQPALLGTGTHLRRSPHTPTSQLPACLPCTPTDHMSGVLPLLAAYPASLPPLLVVGPRSLRDWLAEAAAPSGLAGRYLFVHCAEINQPGERTSSEGEAACSASSTVQATRHACVQPGVPHRLRLPNQSVSM